MLRSSLAGAVIAHIVAIAGCYQPDVRDCTIRCAEPTDCTGGQVCRDDGWCAMPSVTSCAGRDEGGGNGNSGNGADAAVPGDTSTPRCELGCATGSCVDGVCVIDCSAPESCTNDITCPPNLPCRVVCGERSCTKKVVCGMASSCEVQCTGDRSCQDDIVCNKQRCQVDCLGTSSCTKTKCKDACACDVTCLGVNSCIENSECPAGSCRLGNGCSSQLAGCNDCL